MVTALILVFSLAIVPMVEMSDTRDNEERLRENLNEMRAAIDLYQHQHSGNFPTSIDTLITTPRPDGGFYLRRFPINPLIGTTGWEIASKTSRQGLTDKWIYIGSAPSTIFNFGSPVPGIVDIRATTGANIVTDGINGIPYKLW